MNKKTLKLLSSSLAIASLVFIALPIKAHAQTNQITVTTSQGCIASVSPSTISILSGSSLNLSIFNSSTTNDISVSGAASGNAGYNSKQEGAYPAVLNLPLGAITQTETINFTPFLDPDTAIVSDYCTGNGNPATLTITPYTPAPVTAPTTTPVPKSTSGSTGSSPAPTTTAPSTTTPITTTPVKPSTPNASNGNVQSQSTSTQQKPKNNYNWMYVFMIIPIAMIVLGVYIIRKAIKGSKLEKATKKNKKPKK